jgi:hypothetical protein
MKAAKPRRATCGRAYARCARPPRPEGAAGLLLMSPPPVPPAEGRRSTPWPVTGRRRARAEGPPFTPQAGARAGRRRRPGSPASRAPAPRTPERRGSAAFNPTGQRTGRWDGTAHEKVNVPVNVPVTNAARRRRVEDGAVSHYRRHRRGWVPWRGRFGGRRRRACAARASDKSARMGPEAVFRSGFHDTMDECEARIEIACELFHADKLSKPAACRVTGLSGVEFEGVLSSAVCPGFTSAGTRHTRGNMNRSRGRRLRSAATRRVRGSKFRFTLHRQST